MGDPPDKMAVDQEPRIELKRKKFTHNRENSIETVNNDSLITPDMYNILVEKFRALEVQFIQILERNAALEKVADLSGPSFANVTRNVNLTQHGDNESGVKFHNNNTNPSQNPRNVNTQSRNKVIPPIVIEDDGNRQHVISEIRKITDKVNFCPINSKRYRICVTDSIEHYNKVIDFVEANKLKGNTYTPPDMKPITLLVRNLKFIDDIDETKIKSEFANDGFVVLKAVKWSTRAMAERERFFWLVQFNHNTDMTKLNNKRLMLNISVRYEKPTSKLQIMQCRKCKRFEHAQSSCFNDFRCVKCPDSHQPGDCQLPESSKPYCCNCCKYDHPANSPSCPMYLSLLNRRKGKNIQQSRQRNNTNDFVTVGRNGRPIRSTTPPPPLNRRKQVNEMPSTSLMANANNPNVNSQTLPKSRHAQRWTTPNAHNIALSRSSKSNQPNSSIEARLDLMERNFDTVTTL